MAILKHKRTPKWNRRPTVDSRLTRNALNMWVRDMVNTRLQFRPTEYIIHQKIDYDVIMC